jgi:hypothetical protein
MMAKVHPSATMPQVLEAENGNATPIGNGVSANHQAASSSTHGVNIRKMLSSADETKEDMMKKMSRRKSITGGLTGMTSSSMGSGADSAALGTAVGDDESMVLMLLNHVAGTLGELQQRDASAWREFSTLTKTVHERLTRQQAGNELLSVMKYYKYNVDAGWPETVNIDKLYNQLSTLYLSEQTKADEDNDVASMKVKNVESLSFCPNVRFSNFPPEFACKPCVSVFDGAVLLADISGFSKFAGEMCTRGAKGLDVLHKVTSGFLGHFVQTVYDFDGDGKW